MESATNKTSNIVNLILRRGISTCNVDVSSEIIVKVLLDRYEDPNSKDKWSLTPVHHTALDQLRFRGRTLLNSNSKYYVYNKLNPLTYVTVMDNQSHLVPKVMEILLAGGGNPNAVHKRSYNTPVYWAVRRDSETGLEILKLLLSYSGNPNSINSNKETPVHLAAKNRSIFGLDILKILLENGGDPNAVNNEHASPVTYAALNHSVTGFEMLKLLLESGGVPDSSLLTSSNHFAFLCESNIGLEIVNLYYILL